MVPRFQGSLAASLNAALAATLAWFAAPSLASAQEAAHRGTGEAALILPDLATATFANLGGMNGKTLLTIGIGVCIAGLAFGFVTFASLKKLPVHQAMREVSELIYETCKTYVITQAKFIAALQVVIGVVMAVYFGMFAEDHDGNALGAVKVITIIGFSVLGVLGSIAIAWFGMRVNTFANSRASFASLEGKPFPVYAIPLKAGMSIGMVLISLQLLLMLTIMLFMPADYAGPCFIGLAIGESLGASALRIAGGIFTKVADIGSDLMKIVFKIKEDDARNPGVIADCAGDNAGDSVGPSADGFETYGVTGVALLSFVLLAVGTEANQVKILVWIFTIAFAMIIASGLSYFINDAIARSRYGNAKKMNFEAPLTSLVWITSIISILVTFAISYVLIGDAEFGAGTYWWKLAAIISCGTAAGAIIPEIVKAFTSTESGHVREVVAASKEGGASLNVIAGMTAGNFSAYWLGMTFAAIMGVAYFVTRLDVGTDAAIGAIMTLNGMDVSAVFAFGLVAFGFLGMGPVTIAVDSYGPVTDNAQSVYELSLIENVPNVAAEIKQLGGFDVDFERAKELLEENDGAGNTFKATAKPVLIGTAVVGATTMIFSIIVVLTGLQPTLLTNLSLLHPPFLIGLLAGASVIYWFTGAANHAVATGAYRAVEFIKANIKLEGVEKASLEDSKRVVEICTQAAQKGMLNIFFGLFFATLAFAFMESYFFIGYLISIAIFGLFQALFLANSGGAWDNAKKLVETELKAKGTPLHDACVVGDTVGDPFKDTSSVAMNPVIKFTTLFGLLAVELAEKLGHQGYASSRFYIGLPLLVGSMYFVWRSFYMMRIESEGPAVKAAAPAE
jgi:K(+)-stimulated pyrophosphate-energized sodium pump